jgi:hypothetical protein
MLDEQQLHSKTAKLAFFDAKRGEAKGLACRAQNAPRMRLEGQDGKRAPLRSSTRPSVADQRSVAQMYAVEIPDRQNRVAGMVRAGAGMSDDAGHGKGSAREAEEGSRKIAGEE